MGPASVSAGAASWVTGASELGRLPARPPRRAPEDRILWSAEPLADRGVPPQRAPQDDAVGTRTAPPAPSWRPETTTLDDAGRSRFLRLDDEPASPTPGKRVRVVLAERKGVARPVRTVVDIQEGTGVGELLRSNLIGSQLSVALRFAIGTGLTLGALPLLFALFPVIGRFEVLGLPLPWLLLGLLVYPFLLTMGWWFARTAERVEKNFADHVQE